MFPGAIIGAVAWIAGYPRVALGLFIAALIAMLLPFVFSFLAILLEGSLTGAGD